MFKSASFFRIATDFVLPPLEALEEALQSAQFLPCGATQPESVGWMPPRGNKSTVMVEAVGTQVILRLGIERRPVPASAVKAEVEQRVEKYKQETGRDRVSAKIKKEFKEEAIQSLLPRAFTKRSPPRCGLTRSTSFSWSIQAAWPVPTRWWATWLMH